MTDMHCGIIVASWWSQTSFVCRSWSKDKEIVFLTTVKITVQFKCHLLW
jgi:hypothetical protein